MNVAEVLQQVEALEPGMQKAYLDSVRATVDAATVAEVERLLAADDENGLVELLSLGALSLLIESVRSAFIAGARFEMIAIALPRADREQIGRKEFDVNRAEASSWLAQQVTDTRNTATDNVREAIRSVMGSRRVIGGIQPAGQVVRTDRQAALDLIGRVSPQTGLRTGGVVGLPGNFAQYVANARAQLLSGDPAQLRQYLSRTRRDRRFDGIVSRAIAAGKAVAAKDVDKIAGRYSERLLKTHTEMLARTLAHESLNAGRDRAWEQLVEQGIARERVEKEWRDRNDEKVRNSHRYMRGRRVGLGQPFQTNSGALLRFPGDSSLGAGWDETANCRCIAIYFLRA
ncbi:phage head morphogenesis protein [Pseudomonas baetica]|uniref:phage head morphogenesis protein n=1 Tax=Pseudomonas baetica TaxID=674054 RepID=UPI001C8CEE01|nr:phage head morphogenesis protein [Pseudomonas baetica]MBX9404820.1 phage head morphogenesis protein [Pseudomonas baetica]